MNNINSFNFSYNLKKIRKNKKISQEKLAEMISTTKTTIYNYEKGIKYPGLEMFIAICEALNVTPNELIYKQSGTIFGTPKFTPTKTVEQKKDIAINIMQCLNQTNIFDYSFENRKDKFNPSIENEVLLLIIKDAKIQEVIKFYLQNKDLFDKEKQQTIQKKLDELNHPNEVKIFTGFDEEF